MIIYFKKLDNQYLISTTETLEDVIEFVSKNIINKYYDGLIKKYIRENIINIKDNKIVEIF